MASPASDNKLCFSDKSCRRLSTWTWETYGYGLYSVLAQVLKVLKHLSWNGRMSSMFVQSDVQFMGSDVYDGGEKVFHIWYLLIWQCSTNESREHKY